MKARFVSKAVLSTLLLLSLGLSGCDYSYTKLDSNGEELFASATQWKCVRDNATGLIWEKKVKEGGLRSQNWTYMNTSNMGSYDPRDEADNGICKESAIDGDGIYCDTEGYVAAVNENGLCGASDWRMPLLQSILFIFPIQSRHSIGPVGRVLSRRNDFVFILVVEAFPSLVLLELKAITLD